MDRIYLLVSDTSKFWTVDEEIASYFNKKRSDYYKVGMLIGEQAQKALEVMEKKYSDLEITYNIGEHYLTPPEAEMFELSLGQLPIDIMSFIERVNKKLAFLKDNDDFDINVIKSLCESFYRVSEEILYGDIGSFIDCDEYEVWNMDLLIENFIGGL